MGLLSFLNGKQRQEPAYPELKAQSYDTTAIALPPIRGGLPVQGNGPNTLDGLKRAARKRSEAQLSTRTAPVNVDAAPAPAPVVARLRSKSLGRPSTAPSIPNVPLPGTSRPKSAGRNTPSFINTKRPPGPPYLVGVHGPEDEQDADAPPPVPPIAARFMSSLPSSPITPSRPKAPPSINGSVLSGRSDGQSSRGGRGGYVDLLDASGAFKPSDFKTRLQAAGARDYGEDVAERNMGVNGVDLNSPAVLAFYALTGGGPLAYRSDGSAVDVHGNRYAADNIPTNLATQVQGKDKDGLLKLANQKMRTAQFPTRTTSLQPQPILSTSDDSLLDKTSAPSRRLSLHGAPTSNSSKQAKQRPLSMHPVVSTAPKVTSATPPDVPRSRPTSPSGTKSQSRSHSKSTSKERSRGNPAPRTQAEQDERTRRARSSSSASRKGRKTQPQEDLSHFHFGVAETDKSLPPLPSSRPSTSGTDSRAQARTAQPRASSQPRSHPRNRSTGAASLRSRPPQLHDIDENLMPVPARDNESVSSKAPSTVASSNNQSRHTADTSLDLGFSMPRINQGKLSHVRGKSSGANSGRLTSTFSSQRAQAPRPADEDDLTTTTDGSDVEPYPDTKKRRHQDGEHLLFNEDRYGSTGGGLPGLFDPMANMSPATSAKPGRITDYRPPTSAPRVKPPSLVSWQDNSSTSSLTISESDRTALSADYDREEQEMDEKLDVKLAVRLRKEMKKRERLSTRRPGRAKAYEIHEQGHAADTEA